MLCSKCGQIIRDQARFCNRCGTVVVQSLIPPQEDPPTDNRKIIKVLARCSKTKKPYGIRFREKKNHPGKWVARWVDVIREESAKQGGYEPTDVPGKFSLHAEYKCPHCGAGSIFQCGCKFVLSCWDGVTNPVTCPWCGITGELGGRIQKVVSVVDM